MQPKFDGIYKKTEKVVCLIKSKSPAENKSKLDLKPTICVNSSGIFDKENPLKKYEISGKRLFSLKHIQENEFVRIEDLAEKLGQRKSLVSKEIKKINKAFKDRLRITEGSPDLIIHSKTSGYSLNKGNYSFEFDI